MKKLTSDELGLVIGGLEQPGENVEQPGPTEAEGDTNQVGQLSHVEQAGPDQA
jgi:hypothetical protein